MNDAYESGQRSAQDGCFQHWSTEGSAAWLATEAVWTQAALENANDQQRRDLERHCAYLTGLTSVVCVNTDA